MKRLAVVFLASTMGRLQIPKTKADIAPTPDDYPFPTTGKQKAQWKREQGPQRGKRGRK